MSVETLIKNSCQTTGEGPHWDETTQSLLYVDINNGKMHRWNSQTGVDEVYTFEIPVSNSVDPDQTPHNQTPHYMASIQSLHCLPTGISPMESWTHMGKQWLTVGVVHCPVSQGSVIGLGQTISHFNWDTKKVTILHKVDSDKHTRFNDGKCDASGRLWCGTMGYEHVVAQPEHNQGSLYSLEVDGSVKKHKGEISISNGLAWTEDNKTMYYIDSVPRKVFGYDYDINAGTMTNERTVVDLGDPNSFPDGMAIDTDGKLWVAVYGAGKVVRFDPITGKNFDELYVTCSRHGASDEEVASFPLTGSVFRVTGLGARGRPAPIYEGLTQI